MRIEYQALAESSLPGLAEDGKYELRITSAEYKERGKSSPNPQIVMQIEFLEGNYQNMFHYFILPGGNDADKDKDKLEFRDGLNNKFCEIFGISMDGGIDTDDFIGASGSAMVSVQIYEDAGTRSNRIDLFRS